MQWIGRGFATAILDIWTIIERAICMPGLSCQEQREQLWLYRLQRWTVGAAVCNHVWVVVVMLVSAYELADMQWIGRGIAAAMTRQQFGSSIRSIVHVLQETQSDYSRYLHAYVNAWGHVLAAASIFLMLPRMQGSNQMIYLLKSSLKGNVSFIRYDQCYGNINVH